MSPVTRDDGGVDAMRELIAAFEDAARRELSARGWRRRRGGIFTSALGDGFDAWLGLNRATKYHPLQVNPVAGVVHRPTMRLVDELLDRRPGQASAVLSCPVGYLTPAKSLLQLEVATVGDARTAACRVAELADAFVLPFARAHASVDALAAALREGRYLAVQDYAIVRLPALLAVMGRERDARAALDDGLATLGDRQDLAAQTYRAAGKAFLAKLDAPAASRDRSDGG
jgi:hypothetical protein